MDFLDKEQEIYALTLTEGEDASREETLPKYFEMDKRIRYRLGQEII